MANTVTIRKLLEGPKHVVVHAYFKSDGASGELTDQVLIDPTTLSPALKAGTGLTLEEVWCDLEGFAGMLEFDATTDDACWKLPTTPGDTYKDFRTFGGIKDPLSAGATGKIQITTVGFTAAGDEGTLILKVRKN